ncbi:hypothetical protein LQ567_09200 [Niabella pedocola]|uniref:Uncharacterized protein n=1 Tax=Niabella pedocola TaxID=1752077 RepID=A0ABS8PPC8_9BACT|nr:hypothetical protein [Niabella pedocola]MCD2422936.1 hypothetical protein [Niabella pedocola]
MKHVIRPAKNNTVLVTDFIPPILITIVALLASIVVVSVSTGIWRRRWFGICAVIPFDKGHLQIGE